MCRSEIGIIFQTSDKCASQILCRFGKAKIDTCLTDFVLNYSKFPVAYKKKEYYSRFKGVQALERASKFTKCIMIFKK